MGKYLDKFRSLMGKKQTDQIMKLLTKKKNSGQIRGVDEFQRELDNLLRELTGTVLTPSLKLFLGEQTSTIDSERYNFMLDRVEDDLVAAFEEADNIAEVQASHIAIIRDMVLKNLKAGVDELETKLSLYEFLNGDGRGFDSAIFSTFRESKEGRTGRQTDVQGLFVDPRTGEPVEASFDARIDLIGERLTLPQEINTTHQIRGVRRLFDSESPQSEVAVDRPGTSLEQMIDNESGTYWVTSSVFSTQPEYVKVKIELDLGAVKEVNYLEIEPVRARAFYIESISYEDSAGVVVSLGTFNVAMSGTTSVMFREISTRRVIVTLRNENIFPLQFQYNEDLGSFLDMALHQPQSVVVKAKELAFSTLQEIIASPSVQSIFEASLQETKGQEGRITKTFNGYEIITGIDNIRVGTTRFLSQGIFVSSPLVSEVVGQVGIKAVERRPYTNASGERVYGESPFSSDAFPMWGSIEYWVAKRDYSSQGILLRSSTFPLLPLGNTRVYHERLVLTEKSGTAQNFNDIGSTVFFTTYGDGDIKVYRNGTEVPNIDAEPGSSEGWSTDEQTALDKTPNSGNPMVFKVRVAGAGEGDIFTISYTPVTSSSFAKPVAPYPAFTSVGGIQAVDLLGDLSARLCPENIVVLDQEAEQVAETRLYLVIILRQNTSDSTLTPALEEYTLVSSKKDSTKFEAD